MMDPIVAPRPKKLMPIRQFCPAERSAGVLWLWNSEQILQEVLDTENAAATMRTIAKAAGGPRKYARYVSFEPISDGRTRELRRNLAILKFEPADQTLSKLGESLKKISDDFVRGGGRTLSLPAIRREVAQRRGAL